MKKHVRTIVSVRPSHLKKKREELKKKNKGKEKEKI